MTQDPAAAKTETPAQRKRRERAEKAQARAEAKAAEEQEAAGVDADSVPAGVLVALIPVGDGDEARTELRIIPVGDTRPLEVGDILANALAAHRSKTAV